MDDRAPIGGLMSKAGGEKGTPMRWSSLLRDRRPAVIAGVGMLAIVGVVASVLAR